MAAESRGVTARSVLAGAAFVGLISIVSPWAILVVKGSQLTSNAIPAIAIFIFFVVVAVAQPIMRLLSRRLAFGRAELITVYVMMLAGSVVVTTGLVGSFLSVITGAIYYATPGNNWEHLYGPYLTSWLSPLNTEAVRHFYEGLPQGMAIPWHAWIRPLVTWTSFLLAFYAVLFCAAILLRGQWVENERLVFPLTRVPLAMVQDEDGPTLIGRLFNSPLMWIGFLIPLLIHSWNSIGNYTDMVGHITLSQNINLFRDAGSFYIRLNFPALGLAYLMPLGVAFSIWFFFVIAQVERVLAALIGLRVATGDIWTSGGGGPLIIAYQQAGAMMVFVLFLLWSAWPHIRRLWRQVFAGEGEGRREVISPRLAFGGLGFGLLFMITWLTLTGLSLYVAVILVLGALGAFIGLSRIVAESGIPGTQTPMVPQAFIVRGFGPEVLGLNNMTGLAMSTVWMGETGANMMNAVVHSLRLTSERGQDRRYRLLPFALALAVVVGLAGSIWFTMHMAYTFGGVNLHSWYFWGAPRWPFTYMSSVYSAPEPFLARFGFTSFGGVVMAALLYLRYRFVSWPLHPIGFPIASTYQISYYLWFSIFLAWIIKGAIVRYGGICLYRSLLPFFLGLVLGEFTTVTAWVFIDGHYGFEGNMIYNF